jgi:hypothetical protein
MTSNEPRYHKQKLARDQLAESLRPVVEAAREQGKTTYHLMVFGRETAPHNRQANTGPLPARRAGGGR